MTDGNTLKQDRAARRQYWKRHIRAWRDSGLSQAAYCREYGLKHYQLCYWKTRLSEDQAGVSFVPLQLSSNLPVPVNHAALRLHTPNGFWIDIAGSFDPNVLKQLIFTVQQI